MEQAGREELKMKLHMVCLAYEKGNDFEKHMYWLYSEKNYVQTPNTS